MQTSIDLTTSPLLILTRRDPLCIYYSILLTSLRLRRGLITHVSFIDHIFNTIIEDLSQHYDSILLLDLCMDFSSRRINSFKDVKKLVIDLESINKICKLCSDDIKLRVLCDICKVMYIIERPEYVLENVKVESLKHVGLPPFPGINYLDISMSIRLSLTPYIPDISGSEKVNIDFNRDFDSITRTIIEHVLKYKLSGMLIDSIIYGTYLVREYLPVQDLLLYLESVLWKDEYVNMLDLVNKDKILLDRNVLNMCFEYVRKVSSTIQDIVKGNHMTYEVDSMILLFRISKILRFYKKWKDIKIMHKPERGVKCIASGTLEKSEFRDRDFSIYEKDGIYVICYEEK